MATAGEHLTPFRWTSASFIWGTKSTICNTLLCFLIFTSSPLAPSVRSSPKWRLTRPLGTDYSTLACCGLALGELAVKVKGFRNSEYIHTLIDDLCACLLSICAGNPLGPPGIDLPSNLDICSLAGFELTHGVVCRVG